MTELTYAERMEQAEAAKRTAYIEGLRILADVLENRPEVPLPNEGKNAFSPVHFYFFSGDDPKGAMAATARALPTSFAKNARDTYFDLKGSLAGLNIELTALRNQVCEWVVTGTHEETVEEQDAEALAAVPTITKTVTVEDGEWVCSPILAAAEEKAEVPA